MRRQARFRTVLGVGAVLRVGVVLLLGGMTAGSVWAETPASPPIRILFVASENAPPGVAAGVALGLEEANHLGQFTGHRFVLESVAPSTLPDTAAAEAPSVVVAAVPEERLRSIAASWGERDTAVLNVGAAEDALRDGCFANLLHVAPSVGMLEAAAAQWRQAHPDASGVVARAWHSDFVKYAARDLNKRFLRSQGEAMGDGAWAGWAAVKMVAETVARTGDPSPAVVLAYLRDTLAFDGQKGVAHRFHPSGQLRQPLLLEVDGKLVGEAPVRGVVDIEDLESLGFQDFPTCQNPEEGTAP